jgi:hypothetical protein
MKTLKEIKSGMLVSVETSTITIEGNNIIVSASFLNSACVEGIYRQMSMELASGDTEANRAEIIARFGRGYLKAADEKKANQVLEVKGTKAGKVPFTQTEIVNEARSMTNDKKALEVLDKIAVYDSEKFGLVLLSVADKKESLISKALVALSERKAERDKAARDALMNDLDVI